jgi:hypothetical protein
MPMPAHVRGHMPMPAHVRTGSEESHDIVHCTIGLGLGLGLGFMAYCVVGFRDGSRVVGFRDDASLWAG